MPISVSAESMSKVHTIFLARDVLCRWLDIANDVARLFSNGHNVTAYAFKIQVFHFRLLQLEFRHKTLRL